jgi:hypothetical protein
MKRPVLRLSVENRGWVCGLPELPGAGAIARGLGIRQCCASGRLWAAVRGGLALITRGAVLVAIPIRMECVSGDSIRVQLERILASPRFAHSERLKRFLRFSVEEALAGRAENLKEYTLALEVFDKAASHDPGADPIVRVEARRLRARLKEYYETRASATPSASISRKAPTSPSSSGLRRPRGRGGALHWAAPPVPF